MKGRKRRKDNTMEEKTMIKLPESELEIMQAIWALNEAGERYISAGLIMKRFPALTRLKLTTVLTLITRLNVKGFIKSEKIGRTNCYTPLIACADYRRFAVDDFVEKVFMDEKLSLINCLLDGNLTEEEKAAIRAKLKR